MPSWRYPRNQTGKGTASTKPGKTQLIQAEQDPVELVGQGIGEDIGEIPSAEYKEAGAPGQEEGQSGKQECPFQDHSRNSAGQRRPDG